MKKSLLLNLVICAVHIAVFGQNNSNWSTGGNATQNGNWLGTTNNEPLVLKTNSNEAFRIKPNGEIKISAFENQGKGVVTFNNNGVLTNRIFPNDTNQIFTGSGNFKSIATLSGWTRTGNVLYNAPGVYVGVGISNPQYPLHVIGDAYFTGVVNAQGVILTNKLMADTMKAGNMFALNNNLHMSAGGINEIYTTTGELRFQSNAGNNNNTLFSPASNGKVGIGTYNPQAKLDVNGSLRVNGNINAPQFSGQGYGIVACSPGGDFFFFPDPSLDPNNPNLCNPSPFNWNLHGNLNTDPNTDFIGTCDGSDLVFRTNSIERMRLTGEGNLGVGTTNPLAKLQINVSQNTNPGGVAASFTAQHSSTLGSMFVVPSTVQGAYNGISQQGDYGIFWSDGVLPDGKNSNSGFVIAPWANNVSGIRVASNGNVGISNPNPTFALDVGGAVNANQFLINGAPLPLSLWSVQGNDLFFDVGATNSASVGIGVAGPSSFYGCPTSICPNGKYTLAVNGGIRAKALKIEPLWADYVFDSTYALMSLDSVESYILQHKHLPGVPSSSEVSKNGIDVGETEAILLSKIEELTLYIIQLQKNNEDLERRLRILEEN